MGDSNLPQMHGRTHCPGGSDPIPARCLTSTFTCLRATWQGSATIADSTETIVNFDTWENEDSTIFGETLSAGKLQKVSLKSQGIYSIFANCDYSANFGAAHAALVLDDSGTSAACVAPVNMSGWNPTFDAWQFSYPATFAATRKYPLFGVTSGDVVSSIYGRLLLKVVQTSGSNQTLEVASFEIHYHGPTQTLI